MRTNRSTPTLLILAATLAALLVGCSIAGTRPAATQLVRPYPDGCADFGFAARRCAAVVAIARRNLDIQDLTATVELLSEPPRAGCGPQPDGTTILCKTSGGGTAVIVRITPPGGLARETAFYCGVGSQGSIACHDDPEIVIATPMEGYHDIACAGEDSTGNPTGCATPVPATDPSARAEARPLSIAALDIPIDHDGPYEVVLGRAGLPNGALQDASASLASPTVPGVVFLDGIRLAVEPIDPAGRPFLNVYEHGWTRGVEEVRVVLRFEVVQHEPGAILPIRNAIVR
ncbi:MAG: hypothetical protein QOI00_2159 [Chloroflexota bacterium]|nr:hypothetical protein [Chloroflexota bacterium]